MKGTAGRTRIAVALGLALILGSLPQLPHGHTEAELSTWSQSAPVELIRSGQVVAEDDASCPVCVLHRLLSQTMAASPRALEKPAAAGTIALPAALSLAERVPWSGSPRGPPSSV